MPTHRGSDYEAVKGAKGFLDWLGFYLWKKVSYRSLLLNSTSDSLRSLVACYTISKQYQ